MGLMSKGVLDHFFPADLVKETGLGMLIHIFVPGFPIGIFIESYLHFSPTGFTLFPTGFTGWTGSVFCFSGRKAEKFRALPRNKINLNVTLNNSISKSRKGKQLLRSSSPPKADCSSSLSSRRAQTLWAGGRKSGGKKSNKSC